MAGRIRIRSNSKNGGGWFLIPFFTIFLVAGLAAEYFLAIKPWYDVSRSQAWDEAPCVIQWTNITSTTSKGKSSYSPEVSYRYFVGDEEYLGERFWFGTGSSSNRVNLEKAMRPFKPGGEAICYVNPSNPEEAVLLRETGPGVFIGLFIGGIFSLVGLGGVVMGIGMVRAERKAKRPPVIPVQGAATDSARALPERSSLFGDDTYRDERDRSIRSIAPTSGAKYTPPKCLPTARTGPDEPLVLEQTVSRGLKAIGMVLFALFWNGITGTITYFAVADFSIIPLLFMSIFLLIGVLILLAAIHSVLQLFNPRTVAVCSHSYLQPGSEFEISWLQKGNPKRIRKLAITLEGKELVTFRQGTKTRTETSVFFSERVLETTDPAEIESGFRDCQIPENAMHTFDGASNKIIWTVQVHGDIPFWPDILDDFTVVVYPPTIQGVPA
ncbi:DUF3592 domain-containing protein [Pirellulaceae bacterium SH449]